jgi:hypothetical protein
MGPDFEDLRVLFSGLFCGAAFMSIGLFVLTLFP